MIIPQEALERLPELAARAKNFTGAEIEGLVRNAASFALARNTDPKRLGVIDEKAVRVEWADFENALLESEPAFGNKDEGEIALYHRCVDCLISAVRHAD
jgi:vesicle-fusing ATPase